MLPDISVIVTCYNYGKYLERCIRSLLNQDQISHFIFEIVIVDDASSDNTPVIIQKFSSIFDGIKYIRNDKNKGLAQSCNIGISNSIGRYIVRVDADDWVNRNFLFLLKYALDKNRNYQAFCCDYFETNELEKNTRQVSWIEEEIACAIMYRKECLEDIGLYNEEFAYREGHELRKRFVKKYEIGHLPIPLYYVRKHNSNRSGHDEIKEFDKKLNNI